MGALQPYTSVEELKEDLAQQPLNKEHIDNLLSRDLMICYDRLEGKGYCFYVFGSPTILIKIDDSAEERDVTLLHELVHTYSEVTFGKRVISDYSPKHKNLENVIEAEAQRLYEAEPWMIAYIKERAKMEGENCLLQYKRAYIKSQQTNPYP